MPQSTSRSVRHRRKRDFLDGFAAGIQNGDTPEAFGAELGDFANCCLGGVLRVEC
jgi:hypothetical protein